MLLRTLAVLVLAAVLAVWVAPTWSAKERTLSLRVREPQEIRAALRETARALGERMIRAGDERERPAVSSGPRREPASGEKLTDEDRRRLDRLLEQRLRDNP